ncbi:THUMP domain-containing protein, partial [Mesoplasma grammopterae]
MKKLLALLGVVTLTTNVVVAGVSIANADKNKQNDIKILQSKLQTILNSKTDARWDVSELQKKVDEEIGQGEITVSFKDYAKVKGVATVEFIFKANNKKYTGELSLTQTYTVKENIAEDISTISTRLTSILFEKSHDEWTVTDLQTEINAEYGAGEITVSGGIYSDDNNYTGETKKKAEFTFKGNATTDPQNTLKYKGEIALTHTYTKQTVISNEQIKTVVDDLASHAKFDDKQTAKTAIEVAFAYKEAAGDAESTGIKGIEKAVAKYNKSVVGDKSSFTVTLTLSTGYVLEQTANTVEVTVNLMSRTDISTNNEFKQELTSFVNDEAHKNQAWTKDGLQSALNTKYGSGEFVVTEDDSTVTYDNSELGKKTEKFVITGQGSKENNKQYQGELKVTHDYKVTANISTIKTGLQEILNNDAYEEKTWTLDELQKTVDNKFGKGQITVSEVVALKDDNSNVVNNTKEWKFIGNSNDENEFVYTGGVILTHTWKSYKVLASDIQAAAEAAVNGKSYATIEAAQEGITNAVEAITGVDSVIYPTETPKDWSDETIKFTVTFIENYVIEGKNDFSVKARVGSDITVSTDAVNNAIKEVVNAEG